MAKSRAQQAAIAISMKKAGKKPKRMLKGGKSKTLNKVSKQLAKASKLHAAQSKKIGKLARTMQKGGEYTIKPKETLGEIASAKGISVDELLALNPQIKDRDTVRAGQTIITEAPSESFFGDLNLPSGKKIAKEFLQSATGINQADVLGLIPANVKAFVSDITGIGREEGITEKDLNNREKKALREAIKRAEEKGRNTIGYSEFATTSSPKTKGQDVGGGSFLQNFAPITKYFDPDYSMKTLLGQAKFKKNKDGTYTVTDQYDFNDASKAGFKGVIADIKDQGIIGLSPYKFARNIARNFGSAPGEGMDVNITFQKGGIKPSTIAMSSDTIQGISMDQNAAKIKFERNIKKEGLNPASRIVKQNTQVLKDKDGNFIYRYIMPTEKKHGGVHSDSKVFMKRMGYYQAGGLNQTPMYGSNTIPGTPETAAITYQEADQARLKALEEQLKEAQESTKFQDEAEAEVQKQAATISSIEQGVSQGVKGLDKIGVFDKLKEQGAQRLAKQATKDLIGQAGLRLGTESAGQLGKTIAPKLFEKVTMSAVPSTSSLPASLANFSAPTINMPTSALSLSTPGASPLAQSAISSGAGASKGLIGSVGPGGIGAVASLAGEGLKMASDDQDATTMNVGESIGSGLSGVGTGIGAAMGTAALLGSSLGPLGTAAGAIGGAIYGLGKGLITRGKARKEEAKAEEKKKEEVQRIASKQKLEALKSKEYSGFDFGADIRQRGGFSGALDNIQDGLTLAGLAGPAGPFADIANTFISAGRGLYSGVTGDTEAAKKHALNTGVNLISAIPVIGDTLSAPRAVKAGANLAQKAIVKGKKVKAGANVLQAANIINPTGTFKPSVDMNQTFASETTGVRPPIIPELLNLPKVPQQPPIPKIGPSTRKHGGVKLPGGMAKPIPGSDAIEFKGRSHAQGGIMVDPMTEVEGNETMDQVTMKKGGKRDYFFSQHLKMGGKSFAQRHKDILKKGGSQRDIDALAKLQEKKAGRNPNTVKLGAGGYYQGGGAPPYNPIFNVSSVVPQDNTLIQQGPTGLFENLRPSNEFINKQIQMRDDIMSGKLVYDPVTNSFVPAENSTTEKKEEKKEEKKKTNTKPKEDEKEEQRETFEFTPMPTRPVDLSKITFNPLQPFQGFPTNTNFLTQDSDGDGIPDYVDFTDNSSDPTIPLADTRTTDVEETTNVDESQISEEDKNIINKANSGADLTDFEEKALRRLRRDVPGLAIGAGVAQLIGPAYAFFKKDRVAEQMGAPGRIKAPTLDRVSFNTERAANAADNRAMNRFIETSGIGPAGIIAKMSAYRRKQEGDMKIAAQESRINTQIANREAQMAQQADIRNVANRMQVDQINTGLREAQLAANEDRRLEAIDAFTERTAGLAGDLMSYKATERLARATGDMGIYERDRLRNFLKNQVNPRTGKPYTNADIAELFNKRFGEAQATKEDKKDE